MHDNDVVATPCIQWFHIFIWLHKTDSHVIKFFILTLDAVSLYFSSKDLPQRFETLFLFNKLL